MKFMEEKVMFLQYKGMVKLHMNILVFIKWLFNIHYLFSNQFNYILLSRVLFVTSFRTKLWFILLRSKNHDLYRRKSNFEFLVCLKTSLREKALLSRVFLLSIIGLQLFILNLGQLHFLLIWGRCIYGCIFYNFI